MLTFSQFLTEGPKLKKALKVTKAVSRVSTAPIRATAHYAKSNHGTAISKWNEKNFGILGKALNKVMGLGSVKKKPTKRRKKK